MAKNVLQVASLMELELQKQYTNQIPKNFPYTIYHICNNNISSLQKNQRLSFNFNELENNNNSKQ